MERKLGFRRIKMNFGFTIKEISLPLSAHHHAEIQHKANNCNAKFRFFKSTEPKSNYNT